MMISQEAFREKLLSDPIGLKGFIFIQNQIRYVHHSVFKNSQFKSEPGLRFGNHLEKTRKYKDYFSQFIKFLGDEVSSKDKTVMIDLKGEGKFYGCALRFDWFLLLIIAAPGSKIEWNAARKAFIGHWCGYNIPMNISCLDGVNSVFNLSPAQATPFQNSATVCPSTMPNPRMIASAATSATSATCPILPSCTPIRAAQHPSYTPVMVSLIESSLFDF